MNDEQVKDMKRFVQPGFGGLFYVGAAAALFGVIRSISAFSRGEKELGILFLLFFVGGAVAAAIGIRPFLAGRRVWKEAETRGELPRIAAEFAASEPSESDCLRFGDTYFFAERAGLLPYREIDRVWQYIYQANPFTENQRQLRARLTDGRKIVLCNLERNGKADPLVTGIVMKLKEKNPNIKLGFSPK